MTNNSLSEQLKLFIYDHGDKSRRLLKFLTISFSIAGLLIIVYFHGFSHPPERFILLFWAFRRVVDFFIVRYITNIVLSLSPGKYIRSNLLEGSIVTLLVIDHINFLIFGTNFFTGLFAFVDVNIYIGLVKLMFLVIILNDLGKATFQVRRFKLNPALMLVLSFIILISVGATLLKLPEMTVAGYISWIDAFFTATSASCVTGLTVLDTGSQFTLKGQLVILGLIFAGGLNILTIATFIGSLFHRTGSLQATGLVKGFLDTDEADNLKAILRNVILYALLIQGFGSVLIFLTLGDNFGTGDLGQRLYFSIFHSISAFNNAGFSLLPENLFHASTRFNYPLQLTVASLIVLGGIGFLVLQDIFSRKCRRDRRLHPWKKMLVNTRLVLWVSSALIIGGTILFLIFEYNNTLSDHSFGGKVVVSLFQSITTRTAGFNSVDTSLLMDPTILLFCLLMFIGASPGSTGGGIKTTTFAVALKAAWTNLRGRDHVEFFKRNISWVHVNKTYAILVIAFSILVFLILLMVTIEPLFPIEAVIFEVVSAFGTVGLSMGITPELSSPGKFILIMAMFIGRIGSLTLGLAITRKVIYTKYRYPNERLMIG